MEVHALKSLWKCWTQGLWTEINQHEAYQSCMCIGNTSDLINLKLPVFLIGTDTNQHHLLNLWVQILSFWCWPRLHCFDFGQDHSIKATLSWLWSRPYRCDSGESPTTQFGLLGPHLIMYCMLMCIQQQLNTYVWIIFKLSYYLLAISLFAYLFLFLYLLLKELCCRNLRKEEQNLESILCLVLLYTGSNY